MRAKLVLLACLVLGICHAQNPVKNELKNLILENKTTLEKQDNLEMSLQYKLYESHNSKVPTEEHSGTYIQCKSGSYFKLNTIEMVTIPNLCSVSINGNDKSMYMSKVNSNSTNPYTMLNVVEGYENITKTEREGYKLFVLKAAEITQLPYSRVELYFNASNVMSKQVIYMINNVNYAKHGKEVVSQPKIELSYTTNTGKNASKYFKTDRYFLKNGNEFTASNSYPGFTVINLDSAL